MNADIVEPVGVGLEEVSSMRQRRRLDPLVAVFASVLGLFVLAAIFAPLIAPYSPNYADILNVNAPPSGAHWLGTDDLGRDVLSRLLFGARLSLLAPALIILLSTVLGVALAVSAVWRGGWYKLVVSRALDLLFAIPGLLVAILAVAFVGRGLIAPVIALSLAFTPYGARVVQSVAARERNLAYIESCELAGFGAVSICVRHLIPNLMSMIRAQATIAFGAALVALAGVSFLGLGVQPPTAEWGVMVQEGEASLLNGNALPSLSAAAAIVVVVVLTNVLGDRLDRLGSKRI